MGEMRECEALIKKQTLPAYYIRAVLYKVDIYRMYSARTCNLMNETNNAFIRTHLWENARMRAVRYTKCNK